MTAQDEADRDPGGSLSRCGIEEFVADNVVLLRNVREQTPASPVLHETSIENGRQITLST